MEYRIEQDSLGKVQVPADALWGAQTQRSFKNFQISSEKMPLAVAYALALIKKAAALANLECGKLSPEKANLITQVADEILVGQHDEAFPLSVWQTGSGTQTNMNVNEVIANRANQLAGAKVLHPNDDVNMSQSSNDTFPSAMHIASLSAINQQLLPELEALMKSFKQLETKYQSIIKIGRTHLQDATPLTFGQEVSAWRAMLEEAQQMIIESSKHLYQLALGGTAVGTGINAPEDFDQVICRKIAQLTATPYKPAPNKFQALSSKDSVAFAHSSLKVLATSLMKIANDIRFLASGPRCGIGEIVIPANEPGSSIMPGKVNPTQCEALTMLAVQVMANDTAITIAASQGNFQLNVYMPLLIHNMMQSIRLLSDGMHSFNQHCVTGIDANPTKMTENLQNSLMLVTCLSPTIGYEKAAQVAKYAHQQGLTLKEACLAQNVLTAEEFEQICQPEQMI
ncbi:fumarase, class II [Granulicatella balaenopterae]|uniref:Fumarate hydratase class II n=1 Tax=Granulicatella balaenopterae TaxID=137733 RepID=A0A1H9LGB6_9LACT|nr:class II fumarate hydratase [Granulicatella balaenopterae]SER09973.1 fumarase, class II [Granulicatella balaenopterae]